MNRWRSWSGRPVADLIGTKADDLWEAASRQGSAVRARRREPGRRETVDFDYRRQAAAPDGRSDASTIRGRRPGRSTSSATSRRNARLEEQFRESQKFETIGTLAAGVAHDFNNLLTSIMGNASLMAADLPEGLAASEKLDDILRSSQRAADLTKQLLAYSGKGRHFLQKVELSTMVRRMQGLIEAAVPKKVTLDLDLGKQLPRIDADANQVQQLVLNLVSNAVEAIGEESGRSESAPGATPARPCTSRCRTPAAGWMPRRGVKSSIRSSRRNSRGAGLGLAAVAGIARGHKADIRVTSAPGEGSTFRVSFPSAEALRAAADDRGQRADDTILVVDDEDMVRRIAQRRWRSAGTPW